MPVAQMMRKLFREGTDQHHEQNHDHDREDGDRRLGFSIGTHLILRSERRVAMRGMKSAVVAIVRSVEDPGSRQPHRFCNAAAADCNMSAANTDGQARSGA